MPRSASAGIAVTRAFGGSCNSLDVVRLSKLIEAASASLDGDREAAKDYMQRAAELLRDFSEVRGTAPTPFSCARSGLAEWQQKRVVAYVEANIGTNIRAIDLARVVRLSKGHFFRAFRASFGEPPMAYVVKRRVVLGQKLMQKSRAPLSQIALACGMCDQPHFTRLFHRIVGVSPGLWRRQFAGGYLREVAPNGYTY
jgi:AraC family transcriptional regulator